MSGSKLTRRTPIRRDARRGTFANTRRRLQTLRPQLFVATASNLRHCKRQAPTSTGDESKPNGIETDEKTDSGSATAEAAPTHATRRSTDRREGSAFTLTADDETSGCNPSGVTAEHSRKPALTPM